jgi:hypothetical protein
MQPTPYQTPHAHTVARPPLSTMCRPAEPLSPFPSPSHGYKRLGRRRCPTFRLGLPSFAKSMHKVLHTTMDLLSMTWWPELPPSHQYLGHRRRHLPRSVSSLPSCVMHYQLINLPHSPLSFGDVGVPQAIGDHRTPLTADETLPPKVFPPPPRGYAAPVSSTATHLARREVLAPPVLSPTVAPCLANQVAAGGHATT